MGLIMKKIFPIANRYDRNFYHRLTFFQLFSTFLSAKIWENTYF